MGMPFCGGRKWNQLTEKGVEECRGRTLNKKTADIKRSRLTQSNKNKKPKMYHAGQRCKEQSMCSKDDL